MHQAILLLYPLDENPIFIYGSLGMSVLSTTVAVTGKVFQLFDQSKTDHGRLVGMAVYFASDIISRSIVVAMVFGAQVSFGQLRTPSIQGEDAAGG